MRSRRVSRDILVSDGVESRWGAELDRIAPDRPRQVLRAGGPDPDHAAIDVAKRIHDPDAFVLNIV